MTSELLRQPCSLFDRPRCTQPGLWELSAILFARHALEEAFDDF